MCIVANATLYTTRSSPHVHCVKVTLTMRAFSSGYWLSKSYKFRRSDSPVASSCSLTIVHRMTSRSQRELYGPIVLELD